MAFSAEEMAEIAEIEMEPFDCFKELITIYRTPNIAYVSNGPAFNFAYQEEQSAVNSTYVIRSGQFLATIEYLDNIGEQQLLHPAPDSTLTVPKNFLRLGVTGDAKDYLTQVEKVIIDNQSFIPASDARPRGMFARRYYDYFFQKLA